MHMVSKKDRNKAELETVRISNGGDNQGRSAEKKKNHGKCQRIGLIRDSHASGRHTCLSIFRIQ